MAEPTGHYDRRGIPIHVGDLVRMLHYRHRRRREQMWMYFRIGTKDGVPVLINWNDLRPGGYQCVLTGNMDEMEVLQQSGIELDDDGYVRTFNERPRKQKAGD